MGGLNVEAAFIVALWPNNDSPPMPQMTLSRRIGG